MTEYLYYIGGMGPYIYDDDIDLLDPEDNFPGDTQCGMITNGPIKTYYTPTTDSDVLRFDEIGTMVVGSERVIETFTATGTISYLSNVIYASGAFNLFLPTLTLGEDRIYDIKNVGTKIITLKPNATESTVEIEGETSQPLLPGDSVTVTSDGTEWWVI